MLRPTGRGATMAELTETEFVRRNEVFTTVFYLPQIITVESISGFGSSSVAVKDAEENLPKAILSGGQS